MRVLFVLLLAAVPAFAEIKMTVVEYDVAGTKCKGVLYAPAAVKEPRPGVIVFHEWWGLNDYAKKRAELFAKEGYAAFCADMYGDGKTTVHPKEAGEFAGEVRKNQKVWLARAEGALKTLQAQPGVAKEKIAAVGYCFGGTTAMALGFSGAPVKAIAAYHAGLPAVTDAEAKAFKGSLFIGHGAADTFIPQKSIDAFRKVLDDAKTRYEFVAYPEATHSFTVEGVEKIMPALKYNAEADKKSWESTLKLFKETLK
jgi:dienelactone hydrolase